MNIKFAFRDRKKAILYLSTTNATFGPIFNEKTKLSKPEECQNRFSQPVGGKACSLPI
jgi:hypothetical protein